MQTLWDYRYAQRTQRMASSAIRELLKLTEQPGIISFGGGLPAPEVFPVDQIADAIRQTVTRGSAVALRYVHLVSKKWLIKTSSGKNARLANKEKFMQEMGLQ